MKNFLAVFLVIFTSSCVNEWNYEGGRGPKNWGDLKEDYKFCKIGYNQSPIDVTADFKDSELQFYYSNSDVEKRRVNQVMQIEFDSRDFAMRLKKKYYVREVQFHHPSEHLVNGKPHSLEMQIYHKNDSEQWLVLAIFLEVGKENPEFNKLIKLLSKKEKDGKLDLSKIVNENDKTFFYDGSLTTPPCTEGIKWYVMKNPVYVSKEQMRQLIKLGIFSKTNARPVQAFHPEKY